MDCRTIKYVSNGFVDVVLGIVAIALVRREVGVVCLPGTNVAVMAVGFVFDMLLDMFLLGRSGKLFLRADKDSNQSELIVLMSCISMFVWHLVPSLRITLTIRAQSQYHSESAPHQVA
jgi:hypothetical protein